MKSVFITRSFWFPIISALVSQLALRFQDFVVLSDNETNVLSGVVVAIVIALVRSITEEPASLSGSMKKDKSQ